MFDFFFKRLARRPAKGRSATILLDICELRSDPLSHPALQAMSVRDLADLPPGELRARRPC